jgi:hypothetical protein
MSWQVTCNRLNGLIIRACQFRQKGHGIIRGFSEVKTGYAYVFTNGLLAVKLSGFPPKKVT